VTQQLGLWSSSRRRCGGDSPGTARNRVRRHPHVRRATASQASRRYVVNSPEGRRSESGPPRPSHWPRGRSHGPPGPRHGPSHAGVAPLCQTGRAQARIRAARQTTPSCGPHPRAAASATQNLARATRTIACVALTRFGTGQDQRPTNRRQWHHGPWHGPPALVVPRFSHWDKTTLSHATRALACAPQDGRMSCARPRRTHGEASLAVGPTPRVPLRTLRERSRTHAWGRSPIWRGRPTTLYRSSRFEKARGPSHGRSPVWRADPRCSYERNLPRRTPRVAARLGWSFLITP
jgi:hypothetical protein